MNMNEATSSLNNDGVNESKPVKGLLEALSEIQRFYIFEKQQEKDIPSDFFTLAQVFTFFNIGFKTGFLESVFYVLFLPFFQVIYPSFKEFFLRSHFTDIESMLFFLSGYGTIFLSTIFLLNSIRKYYQGTITRKAFFYLMLGRTLAFILKGLLVYLLLFYIYNIAINDKEAVYIFAEQTKYILDFFLRIMSENGEYYTYSIADLYNYYMLFIIPSLKVTAINSIVGMSLFGTLPFLVMVIKGYFIYIRKNDNKIKYEEY